MSFREQSSHLAGAGQGSARHIAFWKVLALVGRGRLPLAEWAGSRSVIRAGHHWSAMAGEQAEWFVLSDLIISANRRPAAWEGKVIRHVRGAGVAPCQRNRRSPPTARFPLVQAGVRMTFYSSTTNGAVVGCRVIHPPVFLFSILTAHRPQCYSNNWATP
jgi:hypothetical protein